MNGLYWITNPDDYAEVIYDWLEETSLPDSDISRVSSMDEAVKGLEPSVKDTTKLNMKLERCK